MGLAGERCYHHARPGGIGADKHADTERRAVTFAEAKGGLQFLAGHSVVLILTDVRASQRTTVRGKRSSGHLPRRRSRDEAATFRLHKDSGDGPLVTPDSLAGGKTGLRWAGDHWVTGEDGKYASPPRRGEVFVELIVKENGGES